MPDLTLHNGDCLEVMKSIADKSIDLIICDLPYGCLSAGGECKWDVKIDLEKFWEQIKRIRKSDHSPTLHFCSTKFGYDLIKSNPEEFRYDLVWDKERGVSFLHANKMPMKSHEMIYIFSKAGPFYERKDIPGKPYTRNRKTTVNSQYLRTLIPQTINDGKRCVLSVIPESLSKSKHKGGHPTEKPCDLYRFLIDRYCPPDGVVLDPTFGSGNSVFTAYDMDRSAIGIEKDKIYFDKAAKNL
jgi:site-specific DNA-methyltransferase (adenine-specific)